MGEKSGVSHLGQTLKITEILVLGTTHTAGDRVGEQLEHGLWSPAPGLDPQLWHFGEQLGGE